MVNIKQNLLGVNLTLPNGKYKMIIDDIDMTDGNQFENSYPYVTIWLKVKDNKDTKLNNKLVMKNFSFSIKALGFWRAFLTLCGYADSVLDNPDFELDTDKLKGMEFFVNYDLQPEEKYPKVEIMEKIKSKNQKTL